MSESPGARLHRSVIEAYELSPAELLVLDQCVALADELDRINVTVAALDSVVTSGSRGQDVQHPAVVAQRQHSETLARMLAQLNLPELGSESGESVTTLRACHAAQARWARSG